MKTAYKILLSVLSGILVLFSFPTVLFGWHAPDLAIIAWFALVPLFVATYKSSPRESFALTFIASLVWYGGSVYWVYNAMFNYGGLSFFTSILIAMLMIIILSLYISVVPCLAKWVNRRFRGELIVLLPAIWVSVELCRNYIPCNGFPWANIAMSQYSLLPIIQIVDITGVYGLIFLIVFVNEFVAEFIIRLSGEKVQFFKQKAIVTFIILCAVVAYGFYKLDRIPKSVETGGTVKVGLIQGNIDQGEKWAEEKARYNLDIYSSGTKELSQAPVDLIIWPEASYPWSLADNLKSLPPRNLGISENKKNTNPYLIIGAVTEDADQYMYNSALLFDVNGRVAGIYHKTHLAPFGEYVPYKKLFFFARKLTVHVGDFIEGESFLPLSFGNHKTGILICYEDIFPEISRKQVNNGAEFLATITNDAWFGKTSAPYQHLALSVFRAVENRRYLVRSANTGITAIISPIGRIITESNIFERSMVVSSVFPSDIITTYTFLGDWFAWACVAYTIFMLSLAVKRKKLKTKN